MESGDNGVGQLRVFAILESFTFDVLDAAMADVRNLVRLRSLNGVLTAHPQVPTRKVPPN